MVRATNDWPAEPDPLPVAVEIAKPAELNWRGDAQPGAVFTRLADGAVQLTAEKNPKAGYHWFDLPKQGLYEVLVELDNITPGARLAFGPQVAAPALGQPVPDPVATLAFFHENRQLGMSCRFAAPTDAPASYDLDIHGDVTPLASAHQWVKLIAGGGILKCYIGLDGVHWGRIPIVEWGPWATPIGRFGLWCGPGDGQRTIRMRRTVMREFHELNKLAPVELLGKAPAIRAPNLAAWLVETTKSQPPGVGVSQWQRACAVRTLAENFDAQSSRELILALVDYALGRRAPVAERLALMHEAALLTNVNGDGVQASNFLFQYEMLGEQLARDGDLKPWTSVIGPLARAPLWCAGSYPTTLPPLARRELIGTIFAGQTDSVAETLTRLRLMNQNDSFLDWADDWLTTHRGGVAVADPTVGHVVARHPYIEDLSKEGFSLLSEFDAALDSQAYRDACQIITSAPSPDALGLMPDTHDSQLMVSLAAAVDGALARDAKLRDTMAKQFGPVGMLQVRQAINEGDAPAVAGVTIRYRGTEAAAEAFAWLGDRALSAGDFAAARVDYRQAARIGGRALAVRVAPRDRLAAAMTGEDVGQPAIGPVRFGDMQMSAVEFEAIVAEMRKAHLASRKPEIVAGPVAALAVPAPTGFELHELARFDGEMGENPGNVGGASPARGNTERWLTRQSGEGGFAAVLDPPEKTRGLDWAARQLATAADADRVYVSNRFQTSAFEVKTGKRVWQSSIGGEHGPTHEWTLTPMRPLPLENRVFVRRLTHAGPELVALDKATGVVQWRTPGDVIVASDPVWNGDRLVAIVAAHVGPQWEFTITAFDLQTGARSGQERLAALRDSWFETRVCQLAAVQENYVVVLGATVVCCDSLGKVRWVRRQEWLPPHEDHDWGRQYQEPALVAGDRLLVTQPGVEAVECLDVGTGMLFWRKPLPGIHRMTGLIGDRLIVETDDGLLALSLAKGDVLWHHDTGDLLEAQLCGGPGQLVYARRARTADNPNQSRPMLVWLDSATGQPVAHTGLESLRQDQPMFGPMLVVSGRLWAFSAPNDSDPNRTLYELVPHGAAVRVDRPAHVAIAARAN
jgi:outer membrane protein assembly factor BamB